MMTFLPPVLLKGTSPAGVAWFNTYKRIGWLPGSGTLTYGGTYTTETNADSSTALHAGAITAIGQSFLNAVSGTIFSASLLLSKTGNPTGTATISLYAVGTNVPTGTALATSQTFDVSALTTTMGWYNFYFPQPQQVVVNTNTSYFIVLEYAGGSATNYISVHTDASTPTYSNGNFATRTGGIWTAVTGTDAIFDAYTVTELTNPRVINSQIVTQLFRVPTNLTDTYPSDAALHSLGMHIEADTIGSRDTDTK